MTRPSLRDDGWTVVLDLHGLPIDAAMRLAEAVVAESTRRGRTSIRIIHGSSSSSRLYRNETIKHAIHDWLAISPSARAAANCVKLDGSCLLSLPIRDATNSSRITLRDFQADH